MGSDADMEDYGFEYSDEEPEEQDVDIENQYYNSKGLVETDPEGALAGFAEVVSMEPEKAECFRGADVHDGFLSHLFHALCQKQIVPFKDENLDRGEEILPALLRVIEESHVALVIFSENYANSPWCLDELVKILDCKKNMGQIVVPIFYHVDPSDVQELTGTFSEAFDGLLGEEFKSKTHAWSNALRETAEISGFDSRNIKPESKLIEEIVSLIHEKVNHAFSYISTDDGLVGIDSRVNDIESKLYIGSKAVWFLGIWGMGGIGKTTIARQVYHRISPQFESAFFVANVRERLEKYTLDDLQHEIQSQLLGKEVPISNIVASSYICKWMKRKKVLIVLDDVSDPEQLEVLIGRHDMFGPGSRVVMTSRDKQILMNGCADEICEVEKLNNHEAVQLLSVHAFKEHSPSEECIELAKKLVAYANGIPLALKVLGSTLYNKNTREWEDQLRKLETMADKRIQNILKISFDELDNMEQEIFLDIACFFKGDDRHHAESILQACGLNAKMGITVLFHKALITILEDKLDMHDLLQQMGRDIVREKCIEQPWNCSRLWLPQDIYNVLTKDMGEILVKSISLDISKTRDINLKSSSFRRMKRLRLLKFYNCYYREKECTSYHGVIKIQQPKYFFWPRYSRGIDFLPDELRYLYWYGYPSKALPLKFCPKNLVQLHLIHSHVEQLCIKNQCFESLKLMDLSYSIKLIRIADLSRFPKLEVLHLRGCTSLVEIRSTRPYYSELRHLNLESCLSLCYFSSFLYMERLDFLSLEDCSKITEFPVIPKSIRCLILSKTAVKQVPSSSIVQCSQLTKLELKSCTSLQSLPSNIGELQLLELLNLECCSKLTNLPDSTCSLKSLKFLCLNECENLKELPWNIGNLKSLEKLDATRSDIGVLPPSIKELSKLNILHLRGNRRLEYIPELPSTLCCLSVDNWANLEKISSFRYVTMKSYLYLNSRVCINLDQSSGRKIMDATLFELENSILPWLRRFCNDAQGLCKKILVKNLNFAVRFAGDELPPRMKQKNENGSNIFISMEQYDPLDSMVIVFSTVLASTDYKATKFVKSVIKCECCFETESGFSMNQCCSHELFRPGDKYPEDYALSLENNWVWVYKFELREKQRFKEASFRFFVKAENGDFRLKKCGVLILPF